MLVLSRKVGERILIGDHIAITVVRLAQGGVRLGIEAPSDLIVVREELKTAPPESTEQVGVESRDLPAADGRLRPIR
ncbi:MAG TPA: carbon storage regulator [Pirellulales bacterium]|jgi:carbon storage regulator|nr:carbon storage regulator [Pirellulales bacterium]